MKNVLVLIVAFVVLASLIWAGVERSDGQKKAPAQPLVAAPANPPAAPATMTHLPALMEASEWHTYQNARQAALRASPELQADYADILKEMDGRQTKLDAAMVKADPKLTPVIAKVIALRRKNSVPTVPSPKAASGQPAANPPPVALTPEDLQELRAARATALTSDPDLMADAQKAAEKMRVFENKLDAAMIKANPKVSLVIAKFEAGRKPPGAPVNSSSAK